MNKKGFTLIELVVAIAVFGSIVLIATGIFVRAIQSQRKVISMQNTQENIRFVFEMMSKEIRMSEILTADGLSPTLSIQHPVHGVVAYQFDGGAEQLLREGKAISSSKIKLTGQFDIVKAGIQSRVTIVMKVDSGDTAINLQTTISSRGY